MKKKEWAWTYNYLTDGEDISVLNGEVDIEKPNPDLYSFCGKISFGGNVHPLNLKNFVAKGSNIKNTSWMYGLVVYTGKDTKI